jgi:hypothetical protein
MYTNSLQKAISLATNISINRLILLVSNSLPNDFKTAVKMNPSNLQRIQNQSLSLILEALSLNGESLKFSIYQNKEINLSAISNNGKCIVYVINPTYDMYLESIMHDPFNLQYVNGDSLKEEQYLQLVKTAVSENGLSIKYARCILPEDIYITALVNNLEAIKYIPNPSNTIIKYVLENNGLMINLLGKKTKAICKMAVTQNGLTIANCEQDSKLAEIAVNNNGLALGLIHSNLQTAKIRELAIQQNPKALVYIDNPDLQSVLQAVNLNGMMLQYAKKFQRNAAVITAALANNGLALRYVLDQNEEYILLAIKTILAKQPDKLETLLSYIKYDVFFAK